MPIELTPQERDDATQSLKRYFREEGSDEMSDLRARLLLDFFLTEIAPLAYNRGVQEAGEFFRGRLEDLPATCFEAPFTHWRAKQKR